MGAVVFHSVSRLKNDMSHQKVWHDARKSNLPGIRGIVPVSRREGKKEGSTRKGGEKYGEKISKTGINRKRICGCGKGKKLIEIEKKRQTIPIIKKDTGMSRSDPASRDDHIRGIRWNTQYYDDVFNRREYFGRGCDI